MSLRTNFVINSTPHYFHALEFSSKFRSFELSNTIVGFFETVLLPFDRISPRFRLDGRCRRIIQAVRLEVYIYIYNRDGTRGIYWSLSPQPFGLYTKPYPPVSLSILFLSLDFLPVYRSLRLPLPSFLHASQPPPLTPVSRELLSRSGGAFYASITISSLPPSFLSASLSAFHFESYSPEDNEESEGWVVGRNSS